MQKLILFTVFVFVNNLISMQQDPVAMVEKSISTIENATENLSAYLANPKAFMEVLERELKKKQDELNDLNNQLDEKEKELLQLTEEVADKKAFLEIIGKKPNIASLNSAISVYDKTRIPGLLK